MKSHTLTPIPIDLLISSGFVITMNNQQRTIYPGSVAVSDGKIIATGESAEIESMFIPQKRIDANNHIIMPGLINIHGHASNSLIRGLGGDLPLYKWLTQICWPSMQSAEDEDIYNGVLLSATEMLLNGITTFADMWPGVDIAAQAVAISGQRAMLAHNMKDFGDPKRSIFELSTALAAWKEWNGKFQGRIHVGFGPHSVYSCRRELLSQCAEVAEQNNIHIQIHGSETLEEVRECKERFGISPIELLNETGLLRKNTIVAHAVHLDAHDIELIKNTKTAIAHNISSNLKLASGIAPVWNYLQNDICVGIGTDGAGSNDSLDLLRDLKISVLVQRALSNNAAMLPVETALSLITKNGAQALGLQEHLGVIEPGKEADIILVDMDKPHFTPRHFDNPVNILSHLVFCASGADVDTVIVGGKILVQNSLPMFLDLEDIQNRAQQSSKKVLKAINIRGI